MSQFADRRRYHRCCNLPCKVFMSLDGMRWEQMELANISATGLCVRSEALFGNGAKVMLNVYVYNMLTEFNMRMEGTICRVALTRKGFSYGIRFSAMNKALQVQLDELIASNGNIINKGHAEIQYEEYYSYVLPVDRKA